ncbi:hypothetical protein SNE40_018242 [Patella caerulea]|uniref:SAP domain-containing protein n=1 Tax=Patella caerulea TaxID=87958 RepID=A0AAN8JAG7_PATCE
MEFKAESSKYGSLTINELRKELSKRGAKLSGRIKDLIERLEAYEGNFNFGKSQNDIAQEYEMNTPNEAMFKDLHEDMVVPKISMASVDAYLGPLNKVLAKDSINLVHEKFLCYSSAV